MNKCLILANGRPPKIEQIKSLQTLGYNTLFCADGGADSALELDLIPDFIIGDLDSISFKALDRFNDTSKIIKYDRQDDTDVEKCLKYAIEQGFTDTILLGATGNRLDHTFCNLGVVIKFFNQINVKIVHEKSLLEAYDKPFTLATKPSETISLYGFDSQTKITTTGLKYPLDNESLVFGVNESTSNQALGETVKINVTGGKIFVVRNFNSLTIL